MWYYGIGISQGKDGFPYNKTLKKHSQKATQNLRGFSIYEMAKDYAKAFYRSAAWERCRESFINQRTQIDGGTCQRCGERLGFIVHHVEKITPENVNDTSITLNFENLEYVCKECHDDIHRVDMLEGSGVSLKRTCAFYADGQPIDRRKI